MKIDKILLASHNLGKFREILEITEDLPLKILSAAEVNVPDVEENGETFVENAILKARNAANFVDYSVIADDSGLVVEALNGEPGIYSSRYAGDGASNQERVDKLLKALKEVPDGQREAYFYCSAVFMRHAKDTTPIIVEGKWKGVILKERVGSNGFGYDPVFYDQSLGLGAAELDSNTKNRVSHRGKAFRALFDKLVTLGYL